MNSIHRYLVLFLLASITLITFAAAIKGYNTSMQRATTLFDSELKSLAQTLVSINSLVKVTDVDEEGDLAFQVWQDQQLLMRSNNAPDKPFSAFIQGFREENFLGQRWRTYAFHHAKVDRWVLVAQPVNHRFELAENLVIAAVTPLIFSIPLLALIISMIVKRGLGSLLHLSKALREKKANDLTPIILENTPDELRPVTDTMNHLFARLEGAFLREKRFASDAAHELRTPLSVLKINTHNLLLELNNKGIAQQNLTYLEQGVERMSHVVDQILLLNRTSPDQFSASFSLINLKKLAQKMIAILYPEIVDRQQEIELHGDPVVIMGDEFSVSILLQNLISNASKYSPAQGQIKITIKQHNGRPCIDVEDSGPGIDEQEYQRVFERFYRIGGDRHDSQIIGCGLGLAIVQHIAQLHQAELELSRSATLGGLQFRVIFQSLAVNEHD
ncbi:ATP-binding protein [Neptunicella sp.]|uniref:ATP-binding protein n=1 Tax=Neptunicella sp. TaxID=2125986 RepID=UPI003F68E307